MERWRERGRPTDRQAATGVANLTEGQNPTANLTDTGIDSSAFVSSTLGKNAVRIAAERANTIGDVSGTDNSTEVS